MMLGFLLTEMMCTVRCIREQAAGVALSYRQAVGAVDVTRRADLAAEIRRVKGARRLGVPVGNCLTAEQGKLFGTSA